jgi:hypothetical protein
MGFLYALIATNINLIFIRDLPLYNNLWVNITEIFWTTLAGALMGFIVNWPEASYLGIFVASLLGGFTIVIGTIIKALQVSGAFGLVLVTFFYIIFPLIALFVPLTALLRWVAGYILKTTDRTWWKWHSLRLYLALFASVVLVGSFAMYSKEAVAVLQAMNNQIIKIQTSGTEKVPYVFQTVSDVVAHASTEYSLEWTDDLKRFPFTMQGDGNNAGTFLQMVFVYFKSGEEIVCLYKNNAILYLCTQMQ